MAKRILLASPMPTHPANSGASVRLMQIASTLLDMGNDVHFLFIQLSASGSIPQMEAHWGSRFHVATTNHPRRSPARKVVGLIKRLPFSRLYGLDDWFYSIDDWYGVPLDETVSFLARRYHFDVVFVQYVFFSRMLLHFGPAVLKILDTVDIFSYRHRHIENMEGAGTYRWFTATPAGETIGLDRADLVLAIHESDADRLRSMTARPVTVVGHLPEVVPPSASSASDPEILFVGALTPENIHGIQAFRRDILPRIRKRIPAARLCVAGGICSALRGSGDCTVLDYVPDLAEVYRRAPAVINPCNNGTGIAIKSIEALSHSKPLVTTPRGARGLEAGTGTAFWIGNDPADFADKVAQLLDDAAARNTLSLGAYSFARRYRDKNATALAGIITDSTPKFAG